MKTKNNLRLIILWLPVVAVILTVLSCNKKEETEVEMAVTASTVAVKSFSLNSDSKIMNNLDSVFFSIDLDHRIIYNADSLPKGTDVSALVANITFVNSMSKVELAFKKNNEKDTIVNYLANPTDTIDFTHPVKMNVTAENGVNTYEYTIKINVHKQNPESFLWTDSGFYNLDLSDDLVSMKTVEMNGQYYILCKDRTNQYRLGIMESPESPENMEMIDISPGFELNVSSFVSTPDTLWILSENGDLYSSTDGISWINSEENWMSIIGSYSGSVIGIKMDNNGNYMHCHYPENAYISDSLLEDDFPVEGISNYGILDTGWSPQPILMIAGGVDLNGMISSNVWGFDGDNWAKLSQINPPALKNTTLIRYVAYKNNSDNLSVTGMDVWLIFGGLKEDGSFNENLYLSVDNGINWGLASTFMQLPESIPQLSGADAFVVLTEQEKDLSNIWKTTKTRSSATGWTDPDYTISDDYIYWKAPYIHIIGGKTKDGDISNKIWRAVLARLTYTPAF